MKIKPLEKFIGDDEAIRYIGIRADENREGYISKKSNIKPVFPFREHGLVKADIFRLLEESGVGVPDYYKWRSRSGCFFCFFQRKYEWIMLAEEHPDLFAEAIQYEQNHSDGRSYTWTEGETLTELLKRKDQIIQKHQHKMTEHHSKKSQPLVETLEDILGEEDSSLPCMICNL